jgi:cell division transport system ATP-binding protein
LYYKKYLMVQFQNVSKIFSNGLAAVRDVDFVINEGEFVFLIGPSGSGKTTLIELLIRDIVPSEGKIYINDTDITKISRKKVYQLRRKIGVIFQDYKLIPDKTAYENVAFAMEAAGKSQKEIKDTVPYVLDIVGLGERMKAFPVQLSGGEKQRVAIARAIANNPKLLIADEPTGNLDPASAWDIVQILTKINNWGTTVIMSTHGTEIVNSLNKRVIQMEKGNVVRDDNKGGYEFSSKFKVAEIAEEIEQEEEQIEIKKPKKLKLNLSKGLKIPHFAEDTIEDIEKKSKRRGIFNFSSIFKKRKNISDKDLDVSDDEVIEESGMQTFSLQKNLSEETKQIKENKISSNRTKNENISDEKLLAKKNLDSPGKIPSKSLEQKKSEKPQDFAEMIKKYRDKPVDILNLPSGVINDLKTAGYIKIGQIIKDGPEKLSENLVIDPDEVIMVAKAISKLLSSTS